MAEIEKFHHYEVLRRDDGSLYELGRGAMGITYKAFDTNLRCTVALKVINGTYLNSEVARQRFVREARAAARLSHPNVAAVFHLGEDVNSYFYAMEFIAGETVEGRVKRVGPLNATAALEITLQVAKALRAAEREGLVHRDIKPANLMLISDEDEGDTFVKVIDFGLAKSAVKEVGDATVTIAGFVGTPHFASPEQLEEHELDVRSDIYSLGITLWWMLTGKPPFSGALAGIMRDHLQKPPPFEVLAGQPQEVITLLRRMLEKEPSKRPQNATELRREIEAVLKTVAASEGFATKLIGGPDEGPDVFATQALTVATSIATVAPSTMSSAPAPTVGVVLSRRYRLLRDCGDRATGKLFQALDLDHNRLVAVRVLHHALLAAPDAQTRIELTLAAAQAASYPGLIAVHSFERTPEGHAILVSEWVNGFSLLDLMRGRSRLPAHEMLQLVEPIAATADFAASKSLDSLELTLDQVLLGFEADFEVGSHPDFLTSPMTEWPTFAPKLSASGFSTGTEAGTYLPEQTMVPAGGAGAAGAGGGGVADFPRRLAMIAFELLSGSPPPATTASGPVRIAPLPSLTEEGNNVLRRGLALGGFKTSAEFVKALKSGGDGTAVVPQRTAATLAPAPAPIVPAKKPSAPGPPSKPPVVPIAIGVGVLLVGGLAYYFLAGKKGLEPRLEITPTPLAVATPVPTTAPTLAPTPLATPQPTQVVVAPTPAPTSAPSLSRHDRFLKALEVARKVDSSMPVDQLNSYLKLAEEYPEEDQGVSRLDSVIAVMVDAAQTPEGKARRFQQVQTQLERAANLGSESALLFLADQTVPVDASVAAGYYRRAAERGNSAAMVALGNLLFKGGPGLPPRPGESARWYRAASDKGNFLGKMALAECYRDGKGGVGRDFSQSTALVSEALTLQPDNPAAMTAMAIAYERGQGVAVDNRRAVELMKRAADIGDPIAIGDLGTYYMKGMVSGQPEPIKAAQLFKKGAELDDSWSMFFYAQCLLSGQGVPKNTSEARNFYRASAERGNPAAIQWCQENRVPFTPR
jgi:serine/threonine protein kinase/TPR repeat protein